MIIWIIIIAEEFDLVLGVWVVIGGNGCYLVHVSETRLYFMPVPFYPRDAMLARVIAIATCPSVRLSVRHAPVLCQNEES